MDIFSSRSRMGLLAKKVTTKLVGVEKKVTPLVIIYTLVLNAGKIGFETLGLEFANQYRS